jgi:hypothetical protein
MGKHKDTRVEMINCKCGCGEQLNKYDGNYRTREYVSGHNGRKYADPKEHKRAWYEAHKHERKEIFKLHKRTYYTQKRDKIITHRGGKCLHCGIKHDTSNTSIFDLHHVDETSKLFNLSSNGLDCNSIQKCILESEKCVVLCSNCHRMHHHTDTVPITKEMLNASIKHQNTLQNIRRFYRARRLRSV